MGINGQDYDHVTGLQSLAVESFYALSKAVMKIRGGNDQLINAFAQRLGESLHFGSAAVSLQQSPDRCRVSFLQGGAQQQMEADYVIVTIPFSVLRNVQLDSSISEAKRTAISKLRHESLMRVYLQSRTRFWLDEGVGGSVFSTDLPIGLVVDHTAEQPGKRGILEAQMEHKNAERVKAMDKGERIQWTLEHMDKVHPGFARNLEGGISFCWDDEPWSQGRMGVLRSERDENVIPTRG